MSVMIKPVLQGTLSPDGEVFEGVWVMREKDFENTALRCPFRYERVEFRSDTDEHIFNGWFEVRSPTGVSSRFTDKKMVLKFFEDEREAGEDQPPLMSTSWTTASKLEKKRQLLPSEPTTSSEVESQPEHNEESKVEVDLKIERKKVILVEGNGQNKLGRFNLNGTMDPGTRLVTVYRVYVPRKKTMGPSRVQRELEQLGNVESPAIKTVSKDPSGAQLMNEDMGNVMNKLKIILDDLMDLDDQKWFCVPVDAAKLGLRDYHDIVTKPMDLGTVKKKFDAGEYSTPTEMQAEIELTFGNALLYNPRGSAVYRLAAFLQESFQEKYAKLMKISTPNAIPPPMMRKLGKRQAVPKIAFEAGDLPYKSERHSPRDRSYSRKRKREGEDNETVERLRKQVKEMSRHLSQLKTALPGAAVFGFDDDYKRNPKTKSSKRLIPEPTFYAKRRLGRDINLLHGDKLRRVVQIIEESGLVLPVSDSGEVELDIDALDNETMHKVRMYVSRQIQAIIPNRQQCF